MNQPSVNIHVLFLLNGLQFGQYDRIKTLFKLFSLLNRGDMIRNYVYHYANNRLSLIRAQIFLTA